MLIEGFERLVTSIIPPSLECWPCTSHPAGCGRYAMRTLSEVEEAKALMIEAVEWSLFRWLFEKRRVRETADQANAALDKIEPCG
jgi:hypothetical protein